jgi:succinate dehydrogenase / fumarate reductase cytochrome b subunit
MFPRLKIFLASSLGKKTVMSLTGLLLVGFLIAHLAGNLLLFAGDDGAAFDAYAKALHDRPAFLYTAEVGLVALFWCHIYLAFRTTLDNREARQRGYAIRQSLGKRTLASSSMFVTGAIVLAFLVIHLLDFRLNPASEQGLAQLVRERLASPLGASIYVVGVVALGVHLSHAVRSALQTLGVNHPRYERLLSRGALGLAALLFLGFVSFPLVLLTGGGRSSSIVTGEATHSSPTEDPMDVGVAGDAGTATTDQAVER